MLIRVRDDGIGMTELTLARVFDMFVQADAALNRAYSGLGIGLTLVRRLVELHGGRVAAFSRGPGQGSEFVVHLPVLRMSDRLDREVPAELSDRPVPRRILIVDDSPDGADSLGQVLRLAGHEVEVCYDGQSAVEAAGRLRPDAILLDIGLPGMDGLETARRLDRASDGKRPLLIAVSGYGSDEDRERARRAGFDHYLVKPPDLRRLAEILAELPTGQGD